MIANLLDNAVRYNESGGRVGVASGTRSGRAVLSVSDTGPVIPAHGIERLFEPFQRLDAERINDDGHRGLGLSIVRAIATAHNGTATAQPTTRRRATGIGQLPGSLMRPFAG